MLTALLRSLRTGVVTIRYPDEPARTAGAVPRRARGSGPARAFDALAAAPSVCPLRARSAAARRRGAIRAVRDRPRPAASSAGAAPRTTPARRIELGREVELAAREPSRDACVGREVRSATPSAARTRIVALPPPPPPAEVADRIRRTLGRSLQLRHLDSGSCNACDWELTALLNPVYDVRRLGIDFVASPRHADGVIVTGPVTRNLELGRPADLRGGPRAAGGHRRRRLRLVGRHRRDGATRAPAASARSCRWTSSSRAARRGPRRSSSGSCSRSDGRGADRPHPFRFTHLEPWWVILAVVRRRSDRGSRDKPRPDQPLDELLARLGTSRRGLPTAETERRLEQLGHDEPTRTTSLSKILELLRGAANPLVIILLIAGTASAFLGEVSDAVIIAVIVFASAGINFWQTFRSDRSVRRLQEQIAPTATVLRDGGWVELPRRQVVEGDIVRLSAGDLVPADARLVEAGDLHVLQAALTGESLPAEKVATDGALSSTGPDSPGLVFLGTSIVSGTAIAVVFASAGETAFGDIVERLAARPEETEFERGTRRFGMLILQTVVFLVLLILVVNLSLGRNAMQSLLFSVALAVGLTPEFLPMITTVTLAQGAIRMAREKVIVKHLASIQNLGSIDVLCSDKTGTLTAGTMSLDASLDPFGRPLERALFLARLNSRFESGIKSPLDAAILAHPVANAEGFSKTDEIPFDFERRRLSVVVEKDGDFLMIAKGAPESVLDACATYEADGRIHPLDGPTAARCVGVFHDMSARGFRVLAVAFRRVSEPRGFKAADERGLTLVGFLTFADHPLEGVGESIARLRRDGVAVKILTGDNEIVTRHICGQVGIDAGRIVLGRDLERMDQAALERAAERAQVFARISPAQKHRIIRALKAHGHVVGFLGDGINDAPSLHGADVGISVAGAVDVAREASDIILLERRIDVLHAGIIAGRKSFGNVLKYILMGTSSNFGNMFSMAGAALFLPFLPMLPTQILLNNLLYDLAQITIPTDNVDVGYTARPQRWDISVIRRFMLLIGPVSSLFDFLTFGALLFVFHFGESAFQTGWFVESLATQVLVLFVIRTTGRPWTNRPSVPLAVTAIVAVLVGVLVPYTPVAAPLGMTPLPGSTLLFVGLVVPSYLILVELLKGRLLQRILPAGSEAVPARR